MGTLLTVVAARRWGTPFLSPRSRRVSHARAKRKPSVRSAQGPTSLMKLTEDRPLRNSALKHGGLVALKHTRNSVSTKLPSISEKPLQLIPSPQTHTWQWVLPT